MLLPISLLSMRTDLPDILKWIEDVENMSFYGFTDVFLNMIFVFYVMQNTIFLSDNNGFLEHFIKKTKFPTPRSSPSRDVPLRHAIRYLSLKCWKQQRYPNEERRWKFRKTTMNW